MHTHQTCPLPEAQLFQYAFQTYGPSILINQDRKAPDSWYEAEHYERNPESWLRALRESFAFLDPRVRAEWLERPWPTVALRRAGRGLADISAQYQVHSERLQVAARPLSDFPRDLVLEVASIMVSENAGARIDEFIDSFPQSLQGPSRHGKSPMDYDTHTCVLAILNAGEKISYKRKSGYTQTDLDRKDEIVKAVIALNTATKNFATWADDVLIPAADTHFEFVAGPYGWIQLHEMQSEATQRAIDQHIYDLQWDGFWAYREGAVDTLYASLQPLLTYGSKTAARAKAFCRLTYVLHSLACPHLFRGELRRCEPYDLIKFLEEAVHHPSAGGPEPIERDLIKDFVRKLAPVALAKATRRVPSEHLAEFLLHCRSEHRRYIVPQVGQIVITDANQVRYADWPTRLAEMLGLFNSKNGGSDEASRALERNLKTALEACGARVTHDPHGNGQSGDVDLMVEINQRRLAIQVKASRRCTTNGGQLDQIAVMKLRRHAYRKAQEQLRPIKADRKLIVTTAGVDIGSVDADGIGIADAYELLALCRTREGFESVDQLVEALLTPPLERGSLCADKPIVGEPETATLQSRLWEDHPFYPWGGRPLNRHKGYALPQKAEGLPILPIPSVNFHLWQPCNFRCAFCYARDFDHVKGVLPKGHLPKPLALKLVDQLAEAGAEKITFAGGEPTLCPWLPELVYRAHQLGLTTMVVTNGSRLTPEYLQRFGRALDWVVLSIDSLSENVNANIGRREGGRAMSEADYRYMVKTVKEAGIRLKINTVVTRKNLDEYMGEFIAEVGPERWKVLQMLPIAGENDACLDAYAISVDEFESFLAAHTDCHAHTTVVPERNDAMTNTYLMVDPAGRFSSNATGRLQTSPPILDVGVATALATLPPIDVTAFEERGGRYDW